MILLTNKEIKQAYGIEGDYGTMERVVKAQLKKVGEWGEDICTDHKFEAIKRLTLILWKRQCPQCWQSLSEEVK